MGEDGAEHRHPERAADGPEQRGAGGRDAEMLVVDAVLHRQDQHLHDHAHAEPQHQRIGRCFPDAHVDGYPGHQQEADGHQDGAGDGERPVAPPAADQAAADDRGHQHAEHHRHELQPRAGRALAFHQLEMDRQIGDRAEQRETHDQPDRAGEGEGAVAEQAQGQDRLARARLDRHKGDSETIAAAPMPKTKGEFQGKLLPPRLVTRMTAVSANESSAAPR